MSSIKSRAYASYLCRNISIISTFLWVLNNFFIYLRAGAAAFVSPWLLSARLHHGPMAIFFIVTHGQEDDDYNEPEDIVRNDGSVCGRILPAEDGVKDSPSTTSIDVWVASLIKLDRKSNLEHSQSGDISCLH